MKISIIIPIYNAEKYLNRCIDSIINQTVNNWELLLVDDGSMDGSLSICEKYGLNDGRIVIIHKENEGLVSARKAGLKVAKGEYVTYVDADDWIEKDMYRHLMQIIINTKADIVTSGCIRDYGNHILIDDGRIPTGLYEGQELVNVVLTNLVSTDNFYQDNLSPFLWNKIYDRKLLLKYQIFVDNRITIGEDLACTYPCILNAESIFILKKSYYHYCMYGNSMMGNSKYNNWDNLQILFNNLKEQMFQQVGRVENIMKQYDVLKLYYTLLKHPEKYVCRRGDYLIPFGKIYATEKVLVYGGGRFGCELINLIKEQHLCELVGWTDKNSSGQMLPLEVALSLPYDKIIIAVLKGNIVHDIIEELRTRDIESANILTIRLDMCECYGE